LVCSCPEGFKKSSFVIRFFLGESERQIFPSCRSDKPEFAADGGPRLELSAAGGPRPEGGLEESTSRTELSGVKYATSRTDSRLSSLAEFCLPEPILDLHGHL